MIANTVVNQKVINFFKVKHSLLFSYLLKFLPRQEAVSIKIKFSEGKLDLVHLVRVRLLGVAPLVRAEAGQHGAAAVRLGRGRTPAFGRAWGRAVARGLPVVVVTWCPNIRLPHLGLGAGCFLVLLGLSSRMASPMALHSKSRRCVSRANCMKSSRLMRPASSRILLTLAQSSSTWPATRLSAGTKYWEDSAASGQHDSSRGKPFVQRICVTLPVMGPLLLDTIYYLHNCCSARPLLHQLHFIVLVKLSVGLWHSDTNFSQHGVSTHTPPGTPCISPPTVHS